MTEKPFHIMKAVERIRPKLRICAAAFRGFWRNPSISATVGKLLKSCCVAQSSAFIGRYWEQINVGSRGRGEVYGIRQNIM